MVIVGVRRHFWALAVPLCVHLGGGEYIQYSRNQKSIVQHPLASSRHRKHKLWSPSPEKILCRHAARTRQSRQGVMREANRALSSSSSALARPVP